MKLHSHSQLGSRPAKQAAAQTWSAPCFAAPCAGTAQRMPVGCSAKPSATKPAEIKVSKGFGKPLTAPSKPSEIISDPCPCGHESGRNYKNCCQPVIEGKKGPTTKPEDVVRARYTAFNRDVDVEVARQFVVDSTHPEFYTHQYSKSQAEGGSEKYAADILEACTKWLYRNFRVVRSEPGETPEEAYVAFSYQCAKRPEKEDEQPEEGEWGTTNQRCHFLQVDGKWLLEDAQSFEIPATSKMMSSVVRES
eukprot:CAMPEP_0119108902 /NCGR_PEP_ID=MMETSP1180-20130426/16065_1 /TAXON_ID=3052 ORGANISM="Chlamydomonas cf sp, Strain CCMP681" /NCGR_SAMPLE_ID=MMETSP1180 /ASSEMBLY_ACC=CAM_ASM_000741 /LENGTH=249 /DNA_ID=CAMNT_0007094579 /DNA_START=22 /DNA_END=771 /DNA_ORIENTATION=+